MLSQFLISVIIALSPLTPTSQFPSMPKQYAILVPETKYRKPKWNKGDLKPKRKNKIWKH